MKDPVPLVPVERLLGPQVDVDSQQFLEILNEAGVILEASPGLPIDEKVLVARLMGFSTSYPSRRYAYSARRGNGQGV